MPTLRQITSWGPGIYRGQKFDRERIRDFVESTNKAIAAGVHIPLLKKHAPPGASDKETEQFASTAGDGGSSGHGAGWVQKFFQDEETGALGFDADNVSEADAKEVKEGRLKFTSPEFRPHYVNEKAGVYEGPIIRHMAFTPTPGNPHQTPLEVLAMQERVGAWQFSEEDFEGPVESAVIDGPKPDDEDEEDNEDEAEDGSDIIEDSQHVGLVTEFGQHGVIVWTVDGNDHKELKKHLKSLHKEDRMIRPSERQFAEGVVDEDVWNKAKEAAGPEGERYKGDAYWGVVSTIYKSMGGKYKSKDEQHAEEAVVNDSVVGTQVEQPPADTGNPDMPPPRTPDRKKMQAVLAGLARKNIVLPSDFDWFSDAALDILMASINSAISAEQEAEAAAQNAVNPEEPPITESSMPFSEEQFSEYITNAKKLLGNRNPSTKARALSESAHELSGKAKDRHSHRMAGNAFHDASRLHYDEGNYDLGDAYTAAARHHFSQGRIGGSQHEEVQFSEEELAKLDEKTRKLVEAGQRQLKAEREARIRAEEEAAQFAENERITKINANRDKAVATIVAAKLTPALTQALVANYTTMQFNENAEEIAVYTPAQVAELFRDSVPKNLLQFVEDAITEADDPIGADGKKIDQFFEHAELPNGHISDEKARKLVDEIHGPVQAMTHPNGVTVPVSQLVAERNAAHPNDLQMHNRT